MSSNARASVKNRANNDPNDEMKRRARRRLVGALALFLTALVVVPALMQGEPNTQKPEIELVFPSKPQMDKDDAQPSQSASAGHTEVTAQATVAPKPGVSAKPEAIIPPGVDEPVATEPVRKPAVPKESAKEVDKATDKATTAKSHEQSKPDVAVKPEVSKSPVEETKSKKPVAAEDPIAKFAQADAKDTEVKSSEAKVIPKVDPKAETKPVAKTEAKPSYVQVAAVKDQARAEELKKELAGKGFSARVESLTTDNGTVYRVRLGPFADAQKADQVKSDLAQKGYTARVAQ